MSQPIQSQITFFSTHDLAKTATFYVAGLGLPLVLDQGTCHIYGVTDTAHIGFCQRVEPFHPDGVILTLVTEDVDGFCERLRTKGVEIESGPRANPKYGIYHAFLRDPNGYLVEIQRFDDPDWAIPPVVEEE